MVFKWAQNEEELKKLTSWRPLTIGSVWVRLYTKILAKRLSDAVKICSRQKGFIAAPGCEENIAILDNLIKGAKRKGDEIAIVFIDLAKTFDSVGHGHIIATLKRYGIDERFIEIVRDLYNCTTRVWVGDKHSESILIRRGVFEKYLGARIDPWIGVGGSSLKEKLIEWNESLNKAPLKPAQKLLILQTYILPRLFYNLL